MRNLKPPTENKPAPENAQRAELAFILREARALLALAHIIDATVGPLTWSYSPERLGAVRTGVQEAAPKLLARLFDLSARLERLWALEEHKAAPRVDGPEPIPRCRH